ncbi:uncharacterized protein EI97DRAFT_458604 [Westerdykella ornata]|uniref:F-box domain-containing protein n=1 Tax=Westerdykella ornata TaxID=318751 RepID=A0A6A6JIQ6_WESOR|nr:uncharacterized protein EI97DRAFT_458604 [Westerdykella ornata]KAF2276105.1 hypothetical protein EI97DRAFT_458604 [Westerdykella ornata]
MLKTLDFNSDQPGTILSTLLAAKPTRLERLCLATTKSETRWTSPNVPKAKNHLKQITTLSLHGANLSEENTTSSLISILDFGSITSLTLSKCIGLPEFCTQLSTTFAEVGLRLRHLTVLPDRGDERSSGPMHSLLQLCGNLQSLHLSVNGDVRGAEAKFLLELPQLRDSLCSLSYHQGGGRHGVDDNDVLGHEMVMEILARFPRLTQFGYNIARQNLDEPDPSFLHQLSQSLPSDLRILHLSYTTVRYEGPQHASYITLHNLKFATALFECCHKTKPNLKYLVLGTHGGGLVSGHGRTERVYQRQHCYVKGFQGTTGQPGSIVAIPISNSQLAGMDPEAAEILNFDPNGYWRGRSPGRFHD